MLLGSALPLMSGVVSLVVLLAVGKVMLGALPLLTGELVVNGVAVLLLVLVSPGSGVVLPLNTG